MRTLMTSHCGHVLAAFFTALSSFCTVEARRCPSVLQSLRSVSQHPASETFAHSRLPPEVTCVAGTTKPWRFDLRSFCFSMFVDDGRGEARKWRRQKSFFFPSPPSVVKGFFFFKLLFRRRRPLKVGAFPAAACNMGVTHCAFFPATMPF